MFYLACPQFSGNPPGGLDHDTTRFWPSKRLDPHASQTSRLHRTTYKPLPSVASAIRSRSPRHRSLKNSPSFILLSGALLYTLGSNFLAYCHGMGLRPPTSYASLIVAARPNHSSTRAPIPTPPRHKTSTQSNWWMNTNASRMFDPLHFFLSSAELDGLAS